MSFPFQYGIKPNTTKPNTFNNLIEHARLVFEDFPDERTGDTIYNMVDAAAVAFSVFFTQSSSFSQSEDRVNDI